uniref:ShKT domain-containing protein n=1 Tax=Globodera rostochiensis TaxID=31243 RepID=A0A914HHN8_GLORO
MRFPPLPHPFLIILGLLPSVLFFGSAQLQLDFPPLEDHGRHHPSLMGPCLDRGQFCDKLKRFCNDFKYQTLINKECRATCGRC